MNEQVKNTPIKELPPIIDRSLLVVDDTQGVVFKELDTSILESLKQLGKDSDPMSLIAAHIELYGKGKLLGLHEIVS
jgi:hypothetical protein